MKNIRNKLPRLFFNILFPLAWLVVSIYIWDFVDAWLEYNNNNYEYLWITGYYFLIPFPISFLLIFLIPCYVVSKYIWIKKKRQKF